MESQIDSSNSKEEQCFMKNKEMLLRDHKREFVGIKEDQILGYTTRRDEMAQFLDEKIGVMTGAFVAKITEEAFSNDEAPPIYDRPYL